VIYEKMLETLNRKTEQFNCRNIVTHRLNPDELELSFEEEIDFFSNDMKKSFKPLNESKNRFFEI